MRTVFDYLQNDYEGGELPRTQLELKLMYLSQAIRSKPRWYEKINHASIKRQWASEAQDQGVNADEIRYVMAEIMEYYMKLVDLPIVPSAVDGVYQSDELIDAELKKKFAQQILALEQVPEHELDWHPGSNNQVLDLVHPSLYCLVNGVSKIIPKRQTNNPKKRRREDDQLEASQEIEEQAEEQLLNAAFSRKSKNSSNKYQWLPAEFAVDSSGKVTIESYINNLNPYVHQELYLSIASIFEKFVPLFNKVVIDLLNPMPHRIPAKIEYAKDYEGYYFPSGTDSDEENENENDLEEEQLFKNHAKEVWEHRLKNIMYLPQDYSQLKWPEIPNNYQPPPPPEHTFDLKGRKLQVIVKIAEICLTPKKPKYEGGVWHVEGMENERIVATGIYYFGYSNITESILAFRTAVQDPGYQQGDRYGVQKVFGIDDHDPMNQPAGFVITKEDRCIAFPNLYQHRVAPFQLKDPKKPGIRKILVFFLVDPTTPIISTALVPPQQESWFNTELKENMKGTWFEKLPKEILDQILSYISAPMSLEDAKRHREKLMKERKFFVERSTKIFERPFSLCEH